MLFTAFVLSLAAMFQGAEAKTVQVTALEDFQTSNPPPSFYMCANEC